MADGLLITAELLERYGACAERTVKFAALWPQGSYITSEAVRKAQREGFSLFWFVGMFCNQDERNYYCRCLDDLRAAQIVARDALFDVWEPQFIKLRQRYPDEIMTPWCRRHYCEHRKLMRMRVAAERKLDCKLYYKGRSAMFDAFMHVTQRFQPTRVRAAVKRYKAKRKS